MEYKKINKDNYTLHLINTDRFKSISLVLFFTKKFERMDMAYNRLLSKNLTYTSKKYNTKNKIAIKGEELYGARVSTSSSVMGNTSQFIVSLDFLNPKYTKKEYLSESIDFLYEILFNPNIKDNAFDEEYFNMLKKDIVNELSNIKDNPSVYSKNAFASVMYKGTPAQYNGTCTVEEIEDITPSSLYEYYKELNNKKYKIDVALYGEFDDEYIPLIEEKLNKLNGTKLDLSYKLDMKYKSDINEKVDNLKFNQSKLYMGYVLNNLTDHETRHVLRVYNTIFGTMNDSILFNIVREKNSLCYSIASYASKYTSSLVVYAGIHKDNYEKSVELIKECKNMMSDKKVLDRLFESAKKTINTYLNSYYDDCTAQVNHYVYNEIEKEEDVEEIRSAINSVTIDEVIALNDKISLNTIYLLKGDNE